MSAANPQVKAHGLFIDGQEVPATSDERLDVLNPATGEVLARISHATEADVDRAVRSARAAFESNEWSSMSNRTRAKLINKLADKFEANLEEMFTLETANNGRSVNETRAQISRLPDFFRYNAGLAIARRDAVIPVDGNYLNYTIRTPVGVVGTHHAAAGRTVRRGRPASWRVQRGDGAGPHDRQGTGGTPRHRQVGAHRWHRSRPHHGIAGRPQLRAPDAGARRQDAGAGVR
jgi:hypothetical protein